MRPLLWILLLTAACRSRLPQQDPRTRYFGAALSALPQVGAALTGGWRVATAERFDLFVEIEGALQFLDDKDFNDDGLPGAGPFQQVRLGLKHSLSPGHKRHLTVRYGAVWCRASGVPTILDQPGDYLGGYVGIGFETELSPRWTMGPEIRLLLLEGLGSAGSEWVPQFAWTLVFRF